MTESTITQRMRGFSKGKERHKHDFYVTPDKAVIELLKREIFEGNGWECASGNGAISKFFPNIKSSDIRTTDDVYGEKGIDFLNCVEPTDIDFIITNPPYSLSLEFAQKAIKIAKKKVVMLFPIQFLESKKRYLGILKDNPPKRIYVFPLRISCDQNRPDTGLVMYGWFVWEIGFKGNPEIHFIYLPGKITN